MVRLALLSSVLVLAGCGGGGLFGGRGIPEPDPVFLPPSNVTLPSPGAAVDGVADAGINAANAGADAVNSATGAVGDAARQVANAPGDAVRQVTNAPGNAARQVANAVPTRGDLGRETVSLGDPTDLGLWVKTGLVSSNTPGTVTAANGETVAVTLRPLDGAGGAQISLPALQALGLPPAGLFPVTLASTG